MSDLFFEIMQLQPNENEFLSAVRDSNSNETAYKLGFMHGRSYAAQMADEYAYRSKNKHERLVEAFLEYRDSIETAHMARLGCGDLNQALADQEIAERKVDELLTQLQAGKGGEL